MGHHRHHLVGMVNLNPTNNLLMTGGWFTLDDLDEKNLRFAQPRPHREHATVLSMDLRAARYSPGKPRMMFRMKCFA